MYTRRVQAAHRAELAALVIQRFFSQRLLRQNLQGDARIYRQLSTTRVADQETAIREALLRDSQATHKAQEETWEQRQDAAVWAVQEQLQASATACTEAEAKAATAVAKAAESEALFRACEDALRQTTELAAKASERDGCASISIRSARMSNVCKYQSCMFSK